MKPVGVMSNTDIDFGTKSNEKDSKFKVGNYLRISKQHLCKMFQIGLKKFYD